jgi:hypothetical protein
MRHTTLALLALAHCTLTPCTDAKTWVVSGSNPAATDKGPATETTPLKTIGAAAAKAEAGDTVLVHGGAVYRERVAPASGDVTYAAAVDTAATGATPPVIRGSEPLPASAWSAPGVGSNSAKQKGVWTASVAQLPFERVAGGVFNPYAIRLAFPGNETSSGKHSGSDGSTCDGGHTLGQVFQDGVLLTELSGNCTGKPDCKELPPMSWMAVHNGTTIWARFGADNDGDGGDGAAAPPQKVEATVRKSVFAPHVRGLGNIVVRGFVMEHAANQWDDFFWLPRTQDHNPSPAAFGQGGLLSTRSGHNWLVEHNVLRHAKTIGIDIGDEGGADPEGNQAMPARVGNHTIQWNRIVDNGGKGLTGEFGSVGPQPFTTRYRSTVTDEVGWQPCPDCEVHRNRGGVIAHNIISGTNYLGCGAEENAALKVHGFSGEVVANLIIENFDSAGMWFDDLWWDLRISRNVVVSESGGPKDADWAGIMMEVSTGPALLDNNVIFTTGGTYGGGIFEADSNNVSIAHNLVMNPVGAALHLSGYGGRSYNCRQVDGEGGNGGEACTGPLSADDVAWLSYGCGTSKKNTPINLNRMCSREETDGLHQHLPLTGVRAPHQCHVGKVPCYAMLLSIYTDVFANSILMGFMVHLKGLAPTNSTTCKNYHAAANIFLGNAPISVSDQCASPAKADGHVCCNNTMTGNAVGKAVDGPSTPGATKNTVTTTTATLVGYSADGHASPNDGSRWNFTTELFLDVTADDAPTAAAGKAGGPGTDVDFFGRPRAGSGAEEAGPFQNVSGATTRYQLWPPGGGGAVTHV